MQTVKTKTKARKKMSEDKTPGTQTINGSINRILSDENLTDSDRQQQLDSLLGRTNIPQPALFETFERVLPGRPRVIAVSGTALNVNIDLKPEAVWPVVEVFEIGDDGLIETAKPVILLDANGHEREVFRHVEILGPCRIIHMPKNPLGYNMRRTAVMQTEAPLRIHVDTAAQAAKNGTHDRVAIRQGTVSGKPERSTIRRPYGC